MKKCIKISHEVPISLLKESKNFNDYDYCLVHLLDKYPKYKAFYKDSDREVILDNSIFELGEAFNDDELIKHILDINPTWYILPDVLEDCDGTIARAKAFLKKAEKFNIISKPIGVVQGKTIEEIIKCHDFMDKELNVEKIAFSFDYSLYETMCEELNDSSGYPFNKFDDWMFGRFTMFERLIEEKVINYDKKYHLLGCALPQEGVYYKIMHKGDEDKYRFIDSIDTSSPIVHGIKGIKYSEYGLKTKESIKLVDLLEEDIQLNDIINYNIDKFRKFWNNK